MDALFELFAPFAGHWRAAIATLSAFFVAAVSAFLFASFTGGHGIGLVLLGLGVGMLWESKAQPRRGAQENSSDVQQS